MLGTINYGTRSIAESKHDKRVMSTVFWSIYTLQFIMSIIASVAYAAYYFFICKDNKVIVLLQGILLFSCFFDISWLYFGVEDFVVTVTRSIVIKVLSVLLIIFLVQSKSDLWKYTLIIQGGTLLSQVVLWTKIGKHVNFVRIKDLDITKHIKPNLVLFVPLLAMSVYHYMDKTMLGYLSTFEQSGYYYNSDKVINIPLGILNGLGTVMLPRMTSLINEKKRNEADNLFVISLEGIGLLTIAMSFGIAGVAKDFIPLFYGPGYEPCILLTVLFTPILVIKSYSVTVRTQYLIPLGLEKDFTISVILGAIVNVFFNLLLIPKYGAVGAVIGTFLAELSSCIFQFWAIRKEISIRRCVHSFPMYLVFGIIMVILVDISTLKIQSHFIGLFLGIIVGVVSYICLCMVFWRKNKSAVYTEFFEPIFYRLKGTFKH